MSKATLEQYLDDYFQNHCTDSTETQEADKRANEYIAKINNADDAWEADWWQTQATYQHERQGFLGGFMYTLRLLDSGLGLGENTSTDVSQSTMQLFGGKAGVVA